MNSVFVLAADPWDLAWLTEQLQRSGLDVQHQPRPEPDWGRATVDLGSSRVYLDLSADDDLFAFSPAPWEQVLEILYSSIEHLVVVLREVAEHRDCLVDNDHGLVCSLRYLLGLFDRYPEFDWRRSFWISRGPAVPIRGPHFRPG